MVAFHHKHQIGVAADAHLGLPGPVGRKIDAAGAHHGDGGFVGRVSDQRANPGGGHLRLAAGTHQGIAKKKLGNGATADVAGANNKYTVVQIDYLNPVPSRWIRPRRYPDDRSMHPFRWRDGRQSDDRRGDISRPRDGRENPCGRRTGGS